MEQTAEAGDGGPGAGPPGGTASGVDPELEALPAPPKGRRLVTLTVMALVVAASIGLLTALRADIAYFFASDEVTDLGKATALDPGTLEPNRFVRIEGTPMASRTVRFSRGLFGGQYAVFPLAGQRDVLVQVPVDDLEQTRTVARREFSGRLVTVGSLGGRFEDVRDYMKRKMDMPVSSETFLLMADEPPGSYAWAVALAGLCLLFVVIDVGLIIRWFRPYPVKDDEDDEGGEADGDRAPSSSG